MDGEPPLDSNTVTHQQQNRWAEVAKTAALVEGIAADDPAAAYGGEVAGENAGTDAVPVEAGLAQIVEYHLVVKNTGAGQESGEIDVRDALPANTVYIAGSATATFRQTANPEGPQAGSVASATIEQPTADNPEVLWKLEGMSDGEEAYLTFRVSAPATAFASGETGMWAEKRFENVAQMIDLAKDETKQTETTHHRVQEAKITATKHWDDADNRDGIRPQNIQVQLYADGVAVGSPVTLDEGSGWMHAWTGLAATNAETGEPLHYTVEETQAVSGYEKPVYAIDATDASLVTIVNKHVPKNPEPPVTPTTPTKPTASPSSSGYGGKGTASTGDQMPLAILGIAAAASAAALVGAGVYAVRKRRKGN